MTPSRTCMLILWIGLLVLVVGGCAKEEEAFTPSAPNMVRKKVGPENVVRQAAPSPESEKSLTAEVGKEIQPVSEKRDGVSFSPSPPNVVRKKIGPTNVVRQAVPSPEPEESLQAKADPAMSPEGTGLPGEAKGPGQETAEVAYTYDPKGKPDPFLPPSSRLKSSDLPKKQVRKHTLPLTPLQKVALGQLKLVGIIVSPGGNKALVEEPSGKGYVISRGTYVGQNFGRVERILPDRVVVQEEIEDFFTGEMRRQTSELIIQKQLGES